jgi:hypothetical protein
MNLTQSQPFIELFKKDTSTIVLAEKEPVLAKIAAVKVASSKFFPTKTKPIGNSPRLQQVDAWLVPTAADPATKARQISKDSTICRPSSNGF